MQIDQKRFQTLCSKYSISLEVSALVHVDLIACYTADSRHYHNLDHIHLMLKAYDQLSYENDAIEFAIWFHDCVYDIYAKDNEEQSAIYFRHRLAMYLDDAFVKKVEALILATRPNSEMSDDPDVVIMRDLDLSVLGLSPQAYKAYSLAIRKEYQSIADDVFYPARKEVLESFLLKPIYKTQEFISLEKQARENVENELLFIKGCYSG